LLSGLNTTQGVRQQRQHPRAEDPGLAVTDLGQQDVDQVVVDLRTCLLGRVGDGHPQLPPGHRGDQVPVLHRAGQQRVVGAAGLEIGAHPQYHQRRRDLIRAEPGGGGRVQRGDERPPLPLLGALGEQLFELVDHQQQPALRRLDPLACGAVGPWLSPWPYEGGLPGGEREPVRIGRQAPAHRRRVRPGQRRHPQRQLIQRRPGRGEHQVVPRRRSRRGGQPTGPDPRQHPGPQQRRLPGARRSGHHQQPRPGQQPRHLVQHLGGGRFPAEKPSRVLLPEHGQPAVRGPGHRPRPRPCALGGRQHLRGRDGAAGRRHEQLRRRPGQAQRTGQQHRGVLVRGPVDAPL
jgi:hypothetical protein